MHPSNVRSKLFTLFQKQSSLHLTLARSRNKMLKGSLFTWYTACRKGNCRCTQGSKHGPFLYAAVNFRGKTFQRYVGKKEDEGLVRKLKTYREFRRNRMNLNHINHKIYRLFDQLQESLT